MKNEIDKIISYALDQKRYRARTYWRQFVLGIFYGLGTAIGATLIFAILVYLVKLLDGLPVIGGWLSQLLKYIQ